MNDMVYLIFTSAVIILLGAYTITTANIMKDNNMELTKLRISSQYMAGLMDDNVTINDTTVGHFISDIQLIKVYLKDRSPLGVLNTCVHETGHYIEYNYIGWNNKGGYEDIFNATDEYVTDYAKTDYHEDFADTFMKSVKMCINMSDIPEDRQEYFKKYVVKYIGECQ